MFVALLALAFVTVACSNTVAVSGVVLDMRTSAPVPGAVVVAGSIKGTSNAKGRFHLASVPKDAKIEVSAANYRTKTVAASANVLTIKIAPIPVTGTALSAFTGKGIPATITGKGLNEKASSDGTFSVYGVGPGDTLTVSAIGHVTATVTIGDNRVANVSLKLGRIDPEALIPVISGYGFENVPKALKDEALRGIRSDPDIGKYITGFAGKSVTSGGEGVAVVVVVAVSPSVAALPGIREAYFSSLTEGAPHRSKIHIDGVVVQRASGGGGFAFAWQRYAGFVAVLGSKGTTVEKIARALLAAEP